MKNETTDRDPRLKQTILTWDFPTRVHCGHQRQYVC